MNSDEYQKLAEIEDRHWFYVGKRQIVRIWLQRLRQLSPADVLLDCGAGTGRFAEEMIPYCQVIAVDDHAESLVLARDRLGPERVREGTCAQLPLGDSTVDVVTALDVLEHIADDRAALLDFIRVLKPGGIMIVTVPALRALWSDWDVILHHQRRYNKKSLLRLVEDARLEVVHCAYINVVALPAVWLVRKLQTLMRVLPGFKRSEEHIPFSCLNNFLRWQFVSLATQRVIQFPAGVGLLAVLQKPVGE